MKKRIVVTILIAGILLATLLLGALHCWYGKEIKGKIPKLPREPVPATWITIESLTISENSSGDILYSHSLTLSEGETVIYTFEDAPRNYYTGAMCGPSNTDFDIYYRPGTSGSWTRYDISTDSNGAVWFDVSGTFQIAIYAYSGSGKYKFRLIEDATRDSNHDIGIYARTRDTVAAGTWWNYELDNKGEVFGQRLVVFMSGPTGTDFDEYVEVYTRENGWIEYRGTSYDYNEEVAADIYPYPDPYYWEERAICKTYAYSGSGEAELMVLMFS